MWSIMEIIGGITMALSVLPGMFVLAETGNLAYSISITGMIVAVGFLIGVAGVMMDD